MAESTNEVRATTALPTTAPPPQLRLHHLFAFTAVMAVMTAISGPQYKFILQVAELPWFARTINLAWGIVDSILKSLAITVVAYGVCWRRRGKRFFREPGHWLLVEIAAATAIGLIPPLILRGLFGSPSSTLHDILFGSLLLVRFVLTPGLDIFIGLRQCSEPRWKWVFFLKALAAVVEVIGDFFVLVMLLRALLVDRRLGVRRDLLHRCGVVIQIIVSLLIGFLTGFSRLLFWMGLWP